jgi:hypothetical protein
VTFEFGCQISTLGEKTFGKYKSLKCILLPKSIETISARCFEGCASFEECAFEGDSKLSTLGEYAFSGCVLKSIDLPANLREVTGLSLADCGRPTVVVDRANRFFRMAGDFLVDLKGVCLVRYFGSEREVTIPVDTEVIGVGCFGHCDSVKSVNFASDRRLLTLGESAFLDCPSLQSICIPASFKQSLKTASGDARDLPI